MFINDTGQIATALWHPTLNLVAPQRISELRCLSPGSQVHVSVSR